MPRYYRRRYTRVVKPKKKWATNLVEITPDVVSQNNTVLFYSRICQNQSQTGTPTPTILKTGNFKLQVDSTYVPQNPAAVNFSAYVMYVPEGTLPGGINVDAAGIRQFVSRHPEWLLAWKYGSNDYITTSGTGNVDSVKVSSRLKRNLNSGDAIYFFAIGETSTGNTFTRADCRGMCQYWTCAN